DSGAASAENAGCAKEGEGAAEEQDPELRALAKEQETQGGHYARAAEKKPIQLLRLFGRAERWRKALPRVDDLVRDMAVAVPVELEILSLAGRCNPLEPGAVETR